MSGMSSCGSNFHYSEDATAETLAHKVSNTSIRNEEL